MPPPDDILFFVFWGHLLFPLLIINLCPQNEKCFLLAIGIPYYKEGKPAF
jgi:hypothetical protein